MAGVLTGLLRNPRTALPEAQAAIKHLLQLQAEQAPCVQAVNAIRLYLDAQVCASGPPRRGHA